MNYDSDDRVSMMLAMMTTMMTMTMMVMIMMMMRTLVGEHRQCCFSLVAPLDMDGTILQKPSSFFIVESRKLSI